MGKADDAAAAAATRADDAEANAYRAQEAADRAHEAADDAHRRSTELREQAQQLHREARAIRKRETNPTDQAKSPQTRVSPLKSEEDAYQGVGPGTGPSLHPLGVLRGCDGRYDPRLKLR